jgi:hypothetical protein
MFSLTNIFSEETLFHIRQFFSREGNRGFSPARVRQLDRHTNFHGAGDGHNADLQAARMDLRADRSPHHT